MPSLLIAVILVPVLGVAGWAVASGHRGQGGATNTSHQGFELGTRFTVKAPGTVSGATIYTPRSSGYEQVMLLRADGSRLGRSARKPVSASGWHQVSFESGVQVTPGVSYVIVAWSDTSTASRTGLEVPTAPKIDTAVDLGDSVRRRGTGLPTETVTLPSPRVLPAFTPAPLPAPTVVTPTATPTVNPGPATSTTATASAKPSTSTSSSSASDSIPSSFPNASNTGVPAGTSLTSYTGSCSIRSDVVITAKTINCDMMVYSGHLTIKSSRVNGIVINDTEAGSLDIVDSEINGGTTGRNVVGSYAVTVLRSNIHGGQHSVQCWGRCTVQDSWLHGQYVPPGGTWHLNAFISNGGSNMKLIHNTLSCDAHITSNDGGCTADASIFGDFDPNTNFTFDRNLFVASTEVSYCAYGGYGNGKPYGTQVSGIVFTNNVFQRGTNGKCGAYGPVTSFNADLPGAVWRNNVWDDGKLLPTP